MGCNSRLLDCRAGITNDASFGLALTTTTTKEYLHTPFVNKTNGSKSLKVLNSGLKSNSILHKIRLKVYFEEKEKKKL